LSSAWGHVHLACTAGSRCRTSIYVGQPLRRAPVCRTRATPRASVPGARAARPAILSAVVHSTGGHRCCTVRRARVPRRGEGQDADAGGARPRGSRLRIGPASGGRTRAGRPSGRSVAANRCCEARTPVAALRQVAPVPAGRRREREPLSARSSGRRRPPDPDPPAAGRIRTDLRGGFQAPEPVGAQSAGNGRRGAAPRRHKASYPLVTLRAPRWRPLRCGGPTRGALGLYEMEA
jgi:hypothetical protein